ncbi:MAG: NADP-dependent phosphogluconate dehydrogenase [Candidatus Bipolaricaulota bacterium]|nr:NADP-dependent phosphogluconate dehydrogenase [Candidatus Bipolaricaulota bacterium]
MNSADFGIIGLAVMGQNLVLNVESRGFTVVVFNRTEERTQRFIKEHGAGKKIIPAYSLEEFVGTLTRPRKILLMVKAGAGTDAVLQSLLPLLEAGDIVMDGGNAHYEETERRLTSAEERGFLYLGVGISGGESGALHGPAIMVGGSKAAYAHVEEILKEIAAKGPEGSCCAYFGPRSAGHYVKMIHNGIEYAIMETIAEAYDLMKRGLGMRSGEMADVFEDWNAGELGGYLFEITEQILRHPDDETGEALVESILDTAKQKGTGKWSTQSALDMGTTSPTIAMAVFARALSGLKMERVAAEKVLSGPALQFNTSCEPFVKDLRGAVTLAVLTAYAQGLRQLKDASVEHGYNLDLAEAARVWMAGCIIRAKLLVPIEKAFREEPDLPLLFLSELFLSLWKDNHLALRRVVIQAHEHGIPVPVMSSALDFLDGYRSGRLPANLLQAQRDLFGAHTYQRVDKEGTFHTEWEAE